MNLLNKFANGDFENLNYEDLRKNFSLKIPENFNFAYDVVDEYAELEPSKKALVWCDDENHEKIMTFEEISK